MKHTLYLVLLCLFCAVALINAQEGALSDSEVFGNKIIFNNEIIDTDTTSGDNLDAPQPQQQQSDTKLRQYLIHVRKDVSEKLRKKLEQDFGDNAEAYYIPHNTFVLIATKQQAKDAVTRNKDLIKWVAEQKQHHKYSEDLWKEINADKINDMKEEALFDVLVAPTKRQTIQDLAKQWEQDLRKTGVESKVYVTSPKKVSVRVQDKKKLKSALSFISELANTRHIQKKEMFGTLEDLDALSDDPTVLAELDPLGDDFKTLIMSEASVLQSHNEKEWIGQPGLPDVQFLWSQGLDGEGEVIGIGDTGLDYYHCAFHDPKGKVPFNKIDLKSHRKIASYWTIADDKDVKHGHGSHVNSIAAGQSDEQPMLDGVAHKAKIAFIDIGLPNGLKLPDDLSTDYFPLVYNATPIVSNSWGNRRYGQYTLAAREIDDFAWRHRDFLPLYAAGNSGRSGGSTLTPPGTAKNALTVGAVQGSYRGFELGLPLYAELLKDQMKAQFCGNKAMVDDTLSFCGGDSSCAETLSHAQMGGDLCDRIKTTKDCCSDPMMKRFCCTKFMLEKLKKNPHWFNPHNVAVFSSRGPTKDNRLKPELLAHGQPVFGARSYGTTGPHCPIPLVMQGTSQATPVMAAFATMTRQYFKKGFYPSGKPNEKDGFNPSGALLKATLINSGTNLPGLVDLNGRDSFAQLKPIPSFTQGFGRVSLTSTLPFAGHSNFTFFKEENEASTGDVHEFCFAVSEDASIPFKTTLVWMDYPASPNAAITLVNNLDLTVVSQDGKVYQGNGGPDHINNVEQVMIAPSKSAGQTYKIIVKGSRVAHGPQFFALVASGNMRKVSCKSVEFAAVKPEKSQQTNQDALKKVDEEQLMQIIASLLSDSDE